ncbi:hypothetical protein EVH13_22740 [Salmonella enterica subsp. enterica serovar Give]|nr:hypothetical protein [Salmonella enterica subsp. enterica serovar Give]ECG2044239.1 hypothetical protein [Salmonella enterica subsp. enterica serovar Kentucky]EEV5958421.1 hypothetical protein [Escherichia coli]
MNQNLRFLWACHHPGLSYLQPDLFFSLEHLCCSEVSISPLFRWPNSVCHFNTDTPFKQTLMLSLGHADFDRFCSLFHRLRPPDKHHRIGRSNQWWRNPTGL